MQAVEEAAHDRAHFRIVLDQQHRKPFRNDAFAAGVARRLLAGIAGRGT